MFWGDGRGTRPDHRGGCVHTGSTQNGTGPCKKLTLLYDISQDGQVTFLSLQRRFCPAKVQPAPGTVREQPLWSDCLDSGPDPRLTGWGLILRVPLSLLEGGRARRLNQSIKVQPSPGSGVSKSYKQSTPEHKPHTLGVCVCLT